jgi:hypothetical protein
VLALHNGTYKDGQTRLLRHRLYTSRDALGRLSATLSLAPPGAPVVDRVEHALMLRRHVEPPRCMEAF